MKNHLVLINLLFVLMLCLSATSINLNLTRVGKDVSASDTVNELVSSVGQPKSTGMNNALRVMSKPDRTTLERVSEEYGKQPLIFELNRGQFDSRVQFASRASGSILFLASTEAVLRLAVGSERRLETGLIGAANPIIARSAPAVDLQVAAVTMKLVGANRAAKATGLDELPGKSNYFIGNDPKKWRVNVPGYARVKYEQVYRGVDLVYYGNQRELEYDLIVAPGANLGAIKLAFDGCSLVRIDQNGDLVVNARGKDIRQLKPRVYQESASGTGEIATHYVMKGKNQVGFELERYDRSKSLVIDPVLSYSTYLGGSSEDIGNGIAVDAAGNAYITGYTASADFPFKDAFQSTLPGFTAAFVTKLNSTGTAEVYSTYMGGNESDVGLAIAVDSAGSAYITGYTTSTNFPVVNAVQPTLGASHISDAFVARLNPSGNALVYSTFLGGNKVDVGQGIAVDSACAAYVTGYTLSPNFPTANALQPALLGRSDAFAAKFNPAGSLAYSTYLGGNGGDGGDGIAVDSHGEAYVAGGTSSPDFPLHNPLQADFKGRTIFKSIDGGGRWSPINNGLPVYLSVDAIAVDPITPSTVYAGTRTGGVFKSTNGGDSWVSANIGLTTTSINALAIDPQDSAVIFAAAASGVYRSTDEGGSWVRSNFDTSACVSFDPTNPSTVYAGNISGICKSTNEGETWTCIPIRAINSGWTPGAVNSIAIDPLNTSVIYVASNSNYIFKSDDRGATWYLVADGLDYGGYKSLVIDPSNTATIYAGSSHTRTYKSSDHGESWQRELSTTFVSDVSGIALAIDRNATSTVYAGTYGANVFKTMDGGVNWEQRRNGLTNSFVLSLAVDPINTSTLYAGAEVSDDAFVVKLDAAGTSLLYSTLLGGDESDYCRSVAVDGMGSAYVTGATFSTNFPTVNPIQSSAAGFYDAFVAKLNSAGSALTYATYLGGGYNDDGFGIAVDTFGNAYVAGVTQSTDFPTAKSLTGALGDTQGNAFVAIVNSTGTALVYSTYLGSVYSETSNSYDAATSIAVDAAGNSYVTGQTFSSQFPITAGAFQPSLRGTSNAFISKLAYFDNCIQDDLTGAILQFNSKSGEYLFLDCRKGTRLSGTGVVTITGCKTELRDKGPNPKRPDRDVYALANSCLHTGSASVSILSLGKTFTIADRDTTNNSSVCGAR